MEAIPRALVVDPSPDEVAGVVRLLGQLNCETVVVGTFEEAKVRITGPGSLAVLVTAVRLREYNGVHLALRARSVFPAARILLTDTISDPVIEREAMKLDAAYLLKPLDLSLAAALLAGGPDRSAGNRRWDRKSLPAGAGAAIGDHAVRLLDVSYGGVRLELPREIGERLPHAVEVTLPGCDLEVRLQPVWTTCPADSDVCVCGGELALADEPTNRRWQAYVDALTGAALGTAI